MPRKTPAPKSPAHVVRLYVSHSADPEMRDSPFYASLSRIAVGAGPVQKRMDGSTILRADGSPLRSGKEVAECRLHDLSAYQIAALCAVLGVPVPAPGEYVSGVVGEVTESTCLPLRALPQVA